MMNIMLLQQMRFMGYMDMVEELVLPSKHLLRRDNVFSYIAVFIIVFFVYSSCPSFADSQQKTEEAYEIIGVSSQDWISYSPDAKKLAVIRTKLFPNQPPIGTSLMVYRINSELQPTQLLYKSEDKGEFFTEFQWVKDQLFYFTINGVDGDSRPPMKMLGDIFRTGSLTELRKHLSLQVWPDGKIKDNYLLSLHPLVPGNLFSSPESETLLLFDMLQDTAKYWNSEEKRYNQTYYTERSIRNFNIRTGISRIQRLSLPFPANRWWGGKGNLVPLSMTKDNGILVALISNNSFWKTNVDQNRPNIISIDLNNGNINSITPDSWLNGLHLSKSSDPQYFAWGNPILTNGDQKVVCQLIMGEATERLLYRFAFFDLSGKKTDEVLIFREDLEKAKTPEGLLVTWTADGTKILIQDGDIWLFDWRSKQGMKVAKSFWIEDVMGWIDENHLLVRGVNTTDSQPLSASMIQKNKKWFILPIK